MKPDTLLVLSALAAQSAAIQAFAQSNVEASTRFSWSESCGWMNWRDAGSPPGQDGAHLNLAGGYLAGYVWTEGAGWLVLGAGGPYANTNGLNFGVNVDTMTGHLAGMAWGESIGWVNFSGGASAAPANPARVDLATLRLRGYAWGESVGWINLDYADDGWGKFVAFAGGTACDSIDFNADGLFPDTADIDDYLSVFSGGPCSTGTCGDTDFNNDGLFPDTLDIDALLSVFSGGPCL